jgi:hypothetical protein
MDIVSGKRTGEMVQVQTAEGQASRVGQVMISRPPTANR